MLFRSVPGPSDGRIPTDGPAQREAQLAKAVRTRPRGAWENLRCPRSEWRAWARRPPPWDVVRLPHVHRQRVDAQIQALEECRSLITWKVGVYAEHLARGEADGLWAPTT